MASAGGSPSSASPAPPPSSAPPPPPRRPAPDFERYERARKATRTKNLLLGGFLGVVAFTAFAGQFYSYLNLKRTREGKSS